MHKNDYYYYKKILRALYVRYNIIFGKWYIVMTLNL